jgi:hypothetical protein
MTVTRMGWNKRGVAFGITLAATALAPAFASTIVDEGVAQAQTPEELTRARELFGEAMTDENAGKFDSALVKFRGVQKTKDTPAVRFRIATCLKNLGKVKEARDTFADIHATAGNKQEEEVEKAAKGELKALEPRVPDLTVKLSGPAAAQGQLTIDGAPATAGQAIQVEPGEHTIVVAGTGVKKMETKVAVAEATHPTLTLQADNDPTWGGGEQPPPPPPPPPTDHSKTYAYIGFGVGGALLASSLVVTFLEKGNVSTIHNDCPGGKCAASKQQEIVDAKNSAHTEYTAAIVLLATGVVATGVGAYFRFKPTPKTQVTVAPTAAGGMLSVGGAF